MKTKEISRTFRLILAGVLALAFAACDDDEPVDDGGPANSTPLSVSRIIVNPRSAGVSDTLLLTAELQSSSTNPGDIPTLKWTADGGAYIEDDEMTVRWVAPAASGIYHISVRATNTANSATGATDVFIGGEVPLVASQAGEVTLINGGPDFYYQRSSSIDLGSEVYKFTGGVGSDATPPARGTNANIVYSPDRNFEVHDVDTIPPASAIIRPRVIHISDLVAGTFERISVDSAAFDSQKRHQFAFPSFSRNGNLVAYSGWLQSPDGGLIDSFHVFTYDLQQNKRSKITGDQAIPRNFFPTFSTDERWLVFVADPTGVGSWELYGAPMTGDVVDPTFASLVKMSDTGGTIGGGSPTTIRKPKMAWNPALSTLAIIATDGTLYMMTTTASGGSAIDVGGYLGTAQSFVWSPSGSRLALTTSAFEFDEDDKRGSGLWLVDGVDATILHSLPEGDIIQDVSWSPDEEWIVYRVVRSAQSWFELLDVDGVTLDTPIPITETRPVSNLGSYRDKMSMSAAWGNGNILYLPAFTGGTTPGIFSIDLSGAVN